MPPIHTRRRSVCPLAGLIVLGFAAAGCAFIPGLPYGDGAVAGASETQEVELLADVLSVDMSSMLPSRLSGTLSGALVGTYVEEILEVYFDGSGVPIAALSRSTFAIESPKQGTLVSMNLVVVESLLMATDDSGAVLVDAQGQPIVTGLQSASTGHIILGSGEWAGTFGDLHSDSRLHFGQGSLGLGALESTVEMNLMPAAAVTAEEAARSPALAAR